MTYFVTKLNPTRIFTLAAVAALMLIAAGATQQAAAQQLTVHPQATRFAQQGSNAAANAMFSGARDLIDDAQWARAEEQFGKYIASYPQEQNLDAAMYWIAYSQYKMRKFSQSKDTLKHLLETYDKTTWREEAELLLAQLPGAVTVKVDPVVVTVPEIEGPVAVSVALAPEEIEDRAEELQERIAEAQARSQERVERAQERMQEQVRDKIKDKADFKYDFDVDFDFDFDSDKSKGSSDDPCEFKIVVLQALFESDPQRAIAVATDWLKPGSAQTVTCKRAALTLLARHGGKGVTPIILGIAQNEADLKLRTRAISLLAASNDDAVIDSLRDFALNSQQPEVAEAALFALSQLTSPRAASVLADIAVSNKPLPVRKSAIMSISNRPGEPAVDALLKIYDSTQEVEIRKSVISGLSRRRSDRAGARLLEIARSADNIEFRKAAINGIGRRGGEPAVDALMGLYDSEKNEELKGQIMNALAYSNDQRVTRKLISIAKNPQTPIERRRRVIMFLSNRSKDPEVIAFLEDLLKQ